MNTELLFYIQQYSAEILLSLPYFAMVSLFGVFLLLRRASLFGAVLSQTAQIGFLIGGAIHFQGHEGAFDLINRVGGKDLGKELLHLDAYVLPITLLLLLPFLIIGRRPMRNMESVLLVIFVFFTGFMPLIHKLLGGNEASLLKMYFTEILYTPREMFTFYIPHLVISGVLLFLFYPGIFLSGYDPVQARLSGYKPPLQTLIFFLLTSLVISAALRVLGIYVTLTTMLAPGIAVLNISRSMKQTLIFTPLLSVFLATCGFLTAFVFADYPAEPIIIAVLAGGAMTIRFISNLILQKRSKTAL